MKKLDILKRYIFRSGNYQVKIGIQAGIGEIRMSGIINGRILPTDAEKKSLSKVLGMDQTELFPEEQESPKRRRAVG